MPDNIKHLSGGETYIRLSALLQVFGFLLAALLGLNGWVAVTTHLASVHIAEIQIELKKNTQILSDHETRIRVNEKARYASDDNSY